MNSEFHPPVFDPEAILAVLERHSVAFVLIGAFGATTQGWSEPTGDVDITPDREVRNIRRLVNGNVDVVTNPAGAAGYPDLARPSESLEVRVGETRVKVARLERIIESKRASDRPKDRDALPRLEKLLDEDAEEKT